MSNFIKNKVGVINMIYCIAYCPKISEECKKNCKLKNDIGNYKDKPIEFIENVLGIKLLTYQKLMLKKVFLK